MVAVEKELGKLGHVAAVLKLGGRDLAGLSEVAIFVENFMDFVFDFGL